MNILVVIANYGRGNDCYLQRVLDEYRNMDAHVDVVVTSNCYKEFGDNVEVRVGLPTSDPRSLPFAHKQVFAERVDKYDLYIYTEDDVLITETNIMAFVRVAGVLAEDELAGFVRTESDAAGNTYFPEVHNQYHWDTTSVCRRGEYTLAFFTDEHAGCYIVTNVQLRKAIASGGFLIGFNHSKYPPLETAATDIYTSCGFRKMVCISGIADFIVSHLSNRYAGEGQIVSEMDFQLQLKALLSSVDNEKPKGTLFPVETKLYHEHWSKSYYEPCQDELLSLLPADARTVLSVGCGWGATEGRLVEKGLKVTAIPMDHVIAACAESRGVEIVYGDADTARQTLQGRAFDCLLLSNVLHLVADPVAFLNSFSKFVTPGGSVIASAPNLSWPRRLSRRIRLRGHMANPHSYQQSGMHLTTANVLRRWFRQAGFVPSSAAVYGRLGTARANQSSYNVLRGLVAPEVRLSAVVPRT